MKPTSGTFNRIKKAVATFGASSFFHGWAESFKPEHLSPVGVIAYPVLYAVGEIFAHFTHEQTAHITEDVLDRLGKSPLQLNHNLQQLFVEAGYQAIVDGIPIWYQNKNNVVLNENLAPKLEEIGKRFKDSFKLKDVKKNNPLDVVNAISSSELIKFLDERTPAECQKVFDTARGIDKTFQPGNFFNGNGFPSEYLKFFNEHFCKTMRILFIEGLKSKEFEKARIAYEQMMAEETFKSLTVIKDEIEQLKNSGKYEESKYAMISQRELTISIEKINSSSALDEMMQNGLENFFNKYDQKIDALVDIANETKVKVEHIDLKTDRIEKGITKNITLSYFLVAVAVVLVAWAFVHFYSNTKNLHLKVVKIEDGNKKMIKSGFMYLDIKKTKDNEAAHILGKLNDEGILTFEKVLKSHLENDTAELYLYGELEDRYRIADSCKRFALKNSDLKIIVLIDEPFKKNPVKVTKETQHVPVSNQPGQKFLCDIDGKNFTDDMSMTNHITFHGKRGSTIGFTGYLEIGGINGEMNASGYTLNVKTGNVTGSLSLTNSCTTITGMLTLKSNGANININFKKTE